MTSRTRSIACDIRKHRERLSISGLYADCYCVSFLCWLKLRERGCIFNLLVLDHTMHLPRESWAAVRELH
jgi:hypothetical protein